MNIILLAQGSALTIYDKLLPCLRKELPLEKIGIYVADQHYFSQAIKKSLSLNSPDISFLKEWKIQADYQKQILNSDEINTLEKKFGNPNFWPALMSDRRIIFGPLTKYKQDYTPRVTYKEMQKQTLHTIKKIENYIEEIKPDAILGFNMVTLGEYLWYLVAKEKGITYRQIKNAKIENYVTLFKDPLALSSEIKNRERIAEPSQAIQDKSQHYLRAAQRKQSTYEGHVLLKPPSFQAVLNPRIAEKLIKAFAFDTMNALKSESDMHSAGLRAVWQHNVVRPIKAKLQHDWLATSYADQDTLRKTPYILFPLHTEPEIALSIYGRFFQNQIEVIRNIAQSIPLTWQVLVKDHPRSLGLRTNKYYKKLLDIPNVQLANPYIPSYNLIEHCQAVVTITSWVGFEAVMSKKPVVTLGETTYNALPSSMVVQSRGYKHLADDISIAIHTYSYNEPALLKHIQTIMSISHPINMYSEILSKPGRHQTTMSKEEHQQSIASFAHYIAQSIVPKTTP